MATLKQLKTFIAVAEYKKMNEAAKRLCISQPTVSQIISDLEAEYHVQLFERSSRSLKITPAGLLLLDNAREIVAIHNHLEQAMENIHSHRPLRVGAALTVGNTLMASLVEHELDMALVEGIIICQEILTEPVLEDTLCLICGRKYHAHPPYPFLHEMGVQHPLRHYRQGAARPAGHPHSAVSGADGKAGGPDDKERQGLFLFRDFQIHALQLLRVRKRIKE